MTRSKFRIKITETFIIIFISLTWSCENSGEDNKESKIFEKKVSVKAESIVPSENLKDPTDIAVMDSLLIVGNYKGEPLVDIFDLKNNGHKYLSVINKGRGPNEIQIIGRIQTSGEKDAFYINDLIGKKILLSEKSNNFEPEVLLNAGDLNKDEETIFDKVLIGKDIFIGESRSPKGRMVFLNKKGEVLGFHLEYPKKEKIKINVNDFEHAKLYASAVTISPDLTKVGLATYLGSLLDLAVIKEDKLVRSFSYNEFYPSKFFEVAMAGKTVAAATNETRRGYSDIASSNDYVYALFSGRYLKDKNYDYGNAIRVSRWDGSKAFELQLDKDIRRLTVGLDNRTIYGIAKNNKGEPEIVRYDIAFLNL